MEGTQLIPQCGLYFMETKILSNGALIIHDIFENPEDGGQAPTKYIKELWRWFRVI